MTKQHGLTAGLLVILAFLAAVGPLATDMYLPSFTAISRDLEAPPSSVQATLTAFMLGIGIGQLVLGPVSDRWGRRPVLLIALAVFAASGIAMIFTPNVALFVALRAVQGVSGAGGIVLSRAIIADLATGAAAVRALSLQALMVAVAPLIAPIIGGSLADIIGWRGVLTVVASAGTLMLVLAVAYVRESLPITQHQHGGIRQMAGNFSRLLGDRDYRLFIAIASASFAAMLAYVSASPFVLQVMLGATPLQFSLAFAVGALALVLGNILNARLAGRMHPLRMLTLGSIAACVAACAIMLLTVTGALSVLAFVPCAFVLSGGVALVMANTNALALARADFARGAGAALLGAFQFLGGALVSPIVGAWGEDTALPMATAIIVASAISLTCVLAVRARGTSIR